MILALPDSLTYFHGTERSHLRGPDGSSKLVTIGCLLTHETKAVDSAFVEVYVQCCFRYEGIYA